ncbi:MAG: hypothetical protein MI799_04325 [Desulfobacterales bacterium]|nr:hypothetical protein [Desulfobacterales bacterium]
MQDKGKSKQSGFDILGKIREALEEAARQAEQARKRDSAGQSMDSPGGQESAYDRPGEDDPDQSFWDEMDNREDVDFYPESADAQVPEPIEPAKDAPVFISQNKESHRTAGNRPETRGAKDVGHTKRHRPCDRSGSERLPAGARGLRKAVVWSEILGKPIALRD